MSYFGRALDFLMEETLVQGYVGDITKESIVYLDITNRNYPILC
jgi:hypothetical protein